MTAKNQPTTGESSVSKPTLILVLLFILLNNRVQRFLTFISSYSPFDRLFFNYHFHYRFKELAITEELIRETCIVFGITFQSYTDYDQYFIYHDISLLTTDQRKVRQFFSHLQRRVGKGNLYITYHSPERFKVKFVKDTLRRDMLIFGNL